VSFFPLFSHRVESRSVSAMLEITLSKYVKVPAHMWSGVAWRGRGVAPQSVLCTVCVTKPCDEVISVEPPSPGNWPADETS